MENVTIMDHPLIQHKISRLRDKTTGRDRDTDRDDQTANDCR